MGALSKNCLEYLQLFHERQFSAAYLSQKNNFVHYTRYNQYGNNYTILI